MKASVVITFEKFTDVDGNIFEKTIKLVNIEISEEFFNDVNGIIDSKQVTVHFEKE